MLLKANRVAKPIGFIVHGMRYGLHCDVCARAQIAENEYPFHRNEERNEAVDGEDRECLNVLLERGGNRTQHKVIVDD